jgi:hypothetical protein
VQLTRRDALAALGAAGAAGAAAGVAAVAGRDPPRADDADPLTTDVTDTLAAAAEVLFPDRVTDHRAFVTAYANARTADREAYREGVAAAVAELDAAARDWYDDRFVDLAVGTRDRLLRELGADTAEPDPDGGVSGRLRYYVVNDLLFAFYASPPGGRLVGIENPTGFPGGVESYRRGPEADADVGSAAGAAPRTGTTDAGHGDDAEAGTWGDDGGRRR